MEDMEEQKEEFTTSDKTSDGFTEVKRKKNKGKKSDQLHKSKHIDGIRLNKPKPNFYWQKMDDMWRTLASMGNHEEEQAVGHATASKHTSSSWNEDFESNDEVDGVIFPEDRLVFLMFWYGL
ncbi:hypothetical protein Tco_1355579 [Tanacetum coccineum]